MRRALLLLCALAFLGFAAYGSVVPLRMRHVSLLAGVEAFLKTPFVPLSRASRTDFATNVLLFVPIGFFALGAAAPRLRTHAAVLLAPVVVAASAASVAIEFSQVFVSGRTPSWNDVFAETLGGIAGALAWLVAGPQTADWFSAILNSNSRRERLLRLLGAYALLWGVLGLLPFDFTIRPQEIAEKLRAGRIVLVPFADRAGFETLLSTFLLAAPIGAFGVVLAHARGLHPAKMWALGIGLGSVGALETGQLLVFSRSADSTDLLLGGCGVLVGIAFALALDRDDEQLPRHDAGLRLWPLAVLALWLVVLAARHWSPFDFRTDGEFVRSRLPAFFRVPFYGYYWANAMSAFSELVTKVLLGLPVGGLLQYMYRPRTPAGRAWQFAGIVLVSFAIFFAIELGQVLLPSRFPDQTDVYIGTFGAVVGLLAVRVLILRPSVPSAPAGSRSPLRADS